MMKKEFTYFILMRVMEILLFILAELIIDMFSLGKIALNSLTIQGDIRGSLEIYSLRFIFYEVIHIPILFKLLKQKMIVLMTANTLTYVLLSFLYYVVFGLPREWFFSEFFMLNCCILFISPLIAQYFIRLPKAFEFLYYCLYRMFTLVKRDGQKKEHLTYLVHALLLSMNTSSILLLFKTVLPLHLIHPYLLKGSYLIVFVFWFFRCRSYFVSKGNAGRIVNHFESEYPGEKKRMALMGISFLLLTPLLFILLAMFLSNS